MSFVPYMYFKYLCLYIYVHFVYLCVSKAPISNMTNDNFHWTVTCLLLPSVLTFVFLLQQYRKLSQSYYPLLECLTQDHMSFITNLEPPVLLYVLTSISEGLTTLGKYHGKHCFQRTYFIVISLSPFFFFFFFFVFLGPHLRHMKVPRLGVQTEL